MLTWYQYLLSDQNGIMPILDGFRISALGRGVTTMVWWVRTRSKRDGYTGTTTKYLSVGHLV